MYTFNVSVPIHLHSLADVLQVNELAAHLAGRLCKLSKPLRPSLQASLRVSLSQKPTETNFQADSPFSTRAFKSPTVVVAKSRCRKTQGLTVRKGKDLITRTVSVASWAFKLLVTGSIRESDAGRQGRCYFAAGSASEEETVGPDR